MVMQKSKANSMTPHTRRGFSVIELLITATVLSIITGLGVIGISRARASVRLAGAAREYASYVEKARTFSIRSHADDATERATITINDSKTSYDVTMDLDGDGDLDTKTIALPDGITFETIEAIAFDWRGRTWNTVGGVTSANAQVSIKLQSSIESVTIDVTGSGDITIDSKVFDDAVPSVDLKVDDLALGATPTPTPASSETPTPSPEPVGTPDVTEEPNPTPTPITGDGTTPSPTPTPTPSSTPTPTPSPTPAPSPTPSPTPSVCTINADQLTVIMNSQGTATIQISHNSTTSISITASSSKPSDLQVTPGGAQSIGAGATTTFTIKSKKSFGTYTVTFSSGCGSKTVPVIVLL